MAETIEVAPDEKRGVLFGRQERYRTYVEVPPGTITTDYVRSDDSRAEVICYSTTEPVDDNFYDMTVQCEWHGEPDQELVVSGEYVEDVVKFLPWPMEIVGPYPDPVNSSLTIVRRIPPPEVPA